MVRRKKACDRDGKAAGQQETTKVGGMLCGKWKGHRSEGNHKGKKRAYEEVGKAAGEKETTKEGGEGLTRSSPESSESVDKTIQNFFFRTTVTLSCKLFSE